MSNCCIIICAVLGTLVPGVCQRAPAVVPMHWGVMDESCVAIDEASVVAKIPDSDRYDHYWPLRYPVKALRERVSGVVTLRVQVAESGRVAAVNVLSASPAGYFEQSSVNAVRSHAYRPHRLGGREVCFSFTRDITFKLDAEAP
jgi:TonB family protein